MRLPTSNYQILTVSGTAALWVNIVTMFEYWRNTCGVEIMTSVFFCSWNVPRTFSSCSINSYERYLTNRNPSCVLDKPNYQTMEAPAVCGNGFVERGEQCDCGSVEVKKTHSFKHQRNLPCSTDDCASRPLFSAELSTIVWQWVEQPDMHQHTEEKKIRAFHFKMTLVTGMHAVHP